MSERLVFCFSDEALRRVLDEWAEAQRKKDPDLLDKHLDYMKGSVMAFLYSGVSQELRMTNLEDALDMLGDIEHAIDGTSGQRLSQDQ